ncbi:MAG: hypothetical protein ABIQ93_07470, partial [Saprospiraceae bacterium]
MWQGLPGLILAGSSVVATVFWLRNRPWAAAQLAFGGGAVGLGLTLISVVPNIEAYSQRSAVDFYAGKSGEDCFIQPVGFKSYAHLFYTRKAPVGADKTVDDYPTLAHGQPGKKVYFVAKITNLGELPDLPDVRELYRKNGFVFFERAGLVPATIPAPGSN